MMAQEARICAVVAAKSAQAMWQQFRVAIKTVRAVELRLDWLEDDRKIERFIARLAAMRERKIPGGRMTVIATCRRREAGGRYRGTIAKQLIHLAEALRAGCEWYDLELESASR
ncbi:MAG TPA: type I 3-dehydroquinate dehydratase, partial [Candidatus Acidoferrum sp.]|nr:type I 3-dehydroquinate dehydratase [Candidatus Acidoferrum sp.]